MDPKDDMQLSKYDFINRKKSVNPMNTGLYQNDLQLILENENEDSPNTKFKLQPKQG